MEIAATLAFAGCECRLIKYPENEHKPYEHGMLRDNVVAYAPNGDILWDAATITGHRGWFGANVFRRLGDDCLEVDSFEGMLFAIDVATGKVVSRKFVK